MTVDMFITVVMPLKTGNFFISAVEKNFIFKEKRVDYSGTILFFSSSTSFLTEGSVSISLWIFSYPCRTVV